MNLSKYEQALHYEIFINEEYHIIKEKLQKSKIIFDIGSHLGFFSLWCLKQNLDLKIHIFEASKENFEKSNALLKDYEKNIIFNNVFVDYEKNIKEIWINQEKSMQTSFYNNQFLCFSNEKENVKCINLMEYIKENNIKNIDLVKIDIEGYEFELLSNINEKIFTITKTLIFEYHILFPDFNLKFELLQNKLKKYYKKIKIQESKYNKNIGLIVCEN
nr:FkbM family methyltransferase [Candidatus Gracilibacteria bacterium]